MGALSIAWYVGLTIVSENILFDSLAALGLMIAFYYGLTGFACAIYYRRELTRSVKKFLLIGVGAARSAARSSPPSSSSRASIWPTRRTRSRATRGSGSARR